MHTAAGEELDRGERRVALAVQAVGRARARMRRFDNIPVPWNNNIMVRSKDGRNTIRNNCSMYGKFQSFQDVQKDALDICCA